jgi:hypothetical protein
MVAKSKPKKATFFQAYLLRDGARADVHERDWNGFLSRVAKLPFEERVVDDYVFEPVQVEDVWALGIHKKLNTQFMSEIDPVAGKMADILDGGSNRRGLAHATAVYFTGIDNVFSLALGGGMVSPQASAVATFLDTFAPAGEGAHWKAEPLMQGDDIRKLRNSRGMSLFKTKFSTKRSLFDAGSAQVGISTFASQIADRIGGDVEVEITVKLEPEARGQANLKNFLSLVVPDLGMLTAKGTGAHAKVKTQEGDEEMLSLVAHRLAPEFEIPSLGTNSHQFSELVFALINVSATMEAKVKEILTG